jgi:hypothetical protein
VTSFPNVAKAARDWLRGLSAVTALVDADRINYGTVSGSEAQIVVTRLFGGDDLGEAPIDQATVQIDAWAPTHDEAHDIAATIRAALHDIRTPTAFGSEGTTYGALTDGIVWAPDDESDSPRYVLTTQLTIRS